MYELLWIALGAALAVLAVSLLRRRSAPPAASAEGVALEPATPTVVQSAVAPDVRKMACGLADELASLVSGVEGRAHHLIEAAPTRAALPHASEALLASVGRLRTLQTKLVAFGRRRPVERGATEVGAMIESLGEELQQMQLGLELHWEPRADLPPIDASPAIVRDAMLFLCAALLRAERGATRLSFAAERSFSRAVPTIKVELTFERLVPEPRTQAEDYTDHAFALDVEAANSLVVSHGGELTLFHLPGRSISAVVRLPIAVPSELRSAPQPAATPQSAPEAEDAEVGHHYGGALVLEADPALRSVLARELKASGRAVFACADGASALTFLEATPDRFELLIVDDANELDAHTPLARAIRARAPDLKICLLTPSPTASTTEQWPGAHLLQKPFGVHELRRKLASILTAG